jgi:NADH-quinone oxidoreductase subunit M
MLGDWPLLSLLIWVPILGGVLVLMAGEAGARRLALTFALVTLGLTIPLYAGFDTSTADIQFREFVPWIEAFNVHYHLGIDGISLPLIMLTAFVTVLVVIAGWRSIEQRVAQYMGAMLILAGIMIGVFCARDAILFYVFFEAQLIPMFLIIGIWGGPNRVYATIKFFLYTLLGSILMLVALLYLYYQAGTFAFDGLYGVPLSMREQVWIFLAMLVAFAVKIPMWPVHTWLPDAHVEAPTGGSVVLAAIMLKMGGYGFLRLALPILPDASALLAELMIVLSLIAIVYIGLVALAQSDLKKLIAYSSISHMGFVTLGTFIVFLLVARSPEAAGARLGIEGAMVQMVSHGLVSAALFLCVGVLYDRMHTRMIADYGGVANVMPVFAAFMVLFAMGNAGLPGTSGFVGEFMVILASFHADLWLAVLAGLTLILGAAYTLWMIKRVVFGPVGNEEVAGLDDLDRREFVVLAVVAIAVIALGVWPAPLLEVMHPAVDNLVGHVAGSKL